MERSAHWIGFDRRIEPTWLDLAAETVAAGGSADDVRQRLMDYLQSISYDSGNSGSARAKTVLVISRMWGAPDERLRHLHTASAQAFPGASTTERVAIHWGMALAAYPYFLHHADVIGKLLHLQGEATASQIRRRVTERWGDRETVHRTSRYVVRSMIAWGALEEIGKGTYGSPDAEDVSTSVAYRLVEALLVGEPGRRVPMSALRANPALFPFRFSWSAALARRCERFEVSREGMDTLMVGLREHGVR